MVHQKLTKSHNSWFLWPVGQAVKTAASHAVNVGSIPARVTRKYLLIKGRYFSFYYILIGPAFAVIEQRLPVVWRTAR